MRRVGIDLALRAPHRAVVFDGAEARGRPFRVERTKEGVDELVRRAAAEAEGPCEFVMEPTGLAWLGLAAEIGRRGHRVYVPKPQKASALRKFYSAFAKTDARDARALALLRHVDPEGVHELRVPTAAQISLRLCVKQRARYVVEATKAKNRIQAWLVLANPLVGEALDDASTDIATAFLRRHVDPFAVRERGKAELRRFWQRHTHGPVDEEQVEKVWAACEKACDLYEALRAGGRLPFEYGVLQDLVRRELEHLEFLEEQVHALDQTIARLYAEVDADRTLQREVPGVGPTIAPAIEALVGDVERFANAKCFAAYFGLVPRTKQTGLAGEKPRQRLTKGGDDLLKQYLFLAAETARRCDPELAATYERALARGKHHYSSVIVVAHKLARRIYALLKLRAAARRAQAEGGEAPAVRYRLRRPNDETVLTLKEARAYVVAHFPTKAAKARGTARPAPQSKAGSSDDATNGGSLEGAAHEVLGAPPQGFVPDHQACGKPVEEPVHNYRESRENFSLDRT